MSEYDGVEITVDELGAAGYRWEVVEGVPETDQAYNDDNGIGIPFKEIMIGGPHKRRFVTYANMVLEYGRPWEHNPVRRITITIEDL